MTYATVLFDLDHTLLDSTQSESEALETTFARSGVTVSAELLEDYRDINRRLWQRLEAGELGVDRLRVQRFEQLVEQRGLDAEPAVMADEFSHWLGECGDLYPDASALLDALHGRVRLGLVTNGVGATQRARVRRHRLDRYFESIVVSGEFGSAKPGTAIFDEALGQLGVTEREQVLMVGDSLSSDMAGAAAAGIAGCWFNPGGVAAPLEPNHHHEVASLGAIAPIVFGTP